MASKMKKTSILTALFASTAFIAVAATSYLAYLGGVESNNNPQATSQYSSAMGQYQMTNAALQAVGYQNAQGQWTGLNGINSQADFLNNPTVQAQAATAYAQQGWNAQVNYGNTSLIGQTVNNVQINQSVLIDCSYYLGPAGCNQWLQNGTFSNSALSSNPGIQNSFTQRMAAASQSDASDITNGQNTVVNNSNIPTSGGLASGNGSNSGQYCDPTIATLQRQAGLQSAQNWILLASSPGTGYTTLGGGSVLQGSGLANNAQGPLATQLNVNDSDFYMVSCIDSLMNSNINIFGLINIPDIIAMLERAACNAVYSMFTEITQPLDQSLGQYTGESIPGIPGLFPGIGLGSIGGGLSTSITPGSATGNGPNLNTGINNSNGTGAGTRINLLTGKDTSWYNGGNAPNMNNSSNYGSIFVTPNNNNQ